VRLQMLLGVGLLSLSVCLRADTAQCNVNGCDIAGLLVQDIGLTDYEYRIEANGHDIECIDGGAHGFNGCQDMDILSPSSLRCEADGDYYAGGVCSGVRVLSDRDELEVVCSGEWSCKESYIRANPQTAVTCSAAGSCVFAEIWAVGGGSVEIDFTGGEHAGIGAKVNCVDPAADGGNVCTIRCSGNSCEGVSVIVATALADSVTVECEDDPQFCPQLTTNPDWSPPTPSPTTSNEQSEYDQIQYILAQLQKEYEQSQYDARRVNFQKLLQSESEGGSNGAVTLAAPTVSPAVYWIGGLIAAMLACIASLLCFAICIRPIMPMDMQAKLAMSAKGMSFE